MSRTPMETTTEIFTRFGNKDVPAIVELLDDEIQIDFYGPSVIPYAGHYKGLNEGRRFFDTVLSSVDIHQFDAEQMFASGEMVTVTGVLHLTARSTGRPIRSDFAHVITVRDGKWLRFRDFMNTAAAVAAFQR